MAISYKILGQASPGNNTNTTVYTVPAGKQAIISSILFTSGDAGLNTGRFLRIHAVKSGASVSESANTIYYLNYTVRDYQNYQFSDKITLAAGDFIAVNHNSSGEASSTMTIFGTEMDV